MGIAASLCLASAPLAVYESSLPGTLNPIYARSMADRRASELVFDRLYYRSQFTAEMQSRLIEQEVVEGQSVLLTLRSGIRWQDGERLEADDLCFSVDVLLEATNPSLMARPFRAELAGCEVVDRRTARVNLVRPRPDPLAYLSFPVLPQHVLGSPQVAPDHAFGARPVGSGPMMARRGRNEVRFSAYANPHHRASIPEVRLAEGGDPLVQVRTLLANGVQGLISVPPALRAEVGASDDLALKAYDLRSWWFIALDVNDPVLARPAVRRALDAALDRAVLRDLAVGFDPDDPYPACELISGPFVPSSPYNNRSIKPRERSDRAEVRAAMAAAGATEVLGGWILDGQPVKLKIGLLAPLDLEARDLLNLIGNQLQEAGFQREIYKISTEDWTSRVLAGDPMGFDLLIGSWSFGLVEDVSELFESRQGNRGTLNLFGYSDPEVDRALESWRRARSLSEAQQAYHQLHARLAEDRPYLFLWKLDTRSAWRAAVRDNVIAPYWYFTDFDAWRYLPEGEQAEHAPSR